MPVVETVEVNISALLPRLLKNQSSNYADDTGFNEITWSVFKSAFCNAEPGNGSNPAKVMTQ